MSDTEAGTFVPVTPAAPGDSEVTDPAAAAAPVDRSPRPAVTPPPGGVPWVMMGVVAAVIGVTAVWQMLGAWAVAGAVVAVLVIVGAASQLPLGRDPQGDAAALAAIREEKAREIADGHDGSWVAHPGLVPVVLDVYAQEMKGRNQLGRLRRDVC